ncbi:MAG: hypothetical protein IPO92_21215 [Saprospiraceae bacterium]|nr:hypothetical protein [Saprospiraceae bacterium]
MFNSTQKPKQGGISFLIIFVILILSDRLSAQCSLVVSNITQPSSCYASDGSISANATDQPGNPCERQIQVFKNGILLLTSTGSLLLQNLNTGDYQIVANSGCGCTEINTQIISLNGGNPSPLIPYVNLGLGSYQADDVFVCRGSNINLGVQSLGLLNLVLKGPNGLIDNTPDGSSFWTLTNVQPSYSGMYNISYTNSFGCISNVNINLRVGNLNVNVGSDKAACIGTTHMLNGGISGQSSCTATCPSSLDSLLINWTLDQCNANGQTNQNDYSEFLPTYLSKANCTNISASNVYRDAGEHSCTPVIGNPAGDNGICIPAMDSCDPLQYDSSLALKFEITINPGEAGRITKLTFKEQSPLNWMTTNGSKGINNYNTKYLLRVYKNGLLIYAENDRLTERIWNLESIDFSTINAFTVSSTSKFRFELRGYCVVPSGGNMSGWELDDIKVYGGCCTGLQTNNIVNYLWSSGETTSSISVSPSDNRNYRLTVTDCNGCSQTDDLNVVVYPLPVPGISGNLSVCLGGSTVLTASGGTSYVWSTGQSTSSIMVTPMSTSNYTVTVTNSNGCLANKDVTVVVNQLPSPIISGDLDICLGQTTTLTASGGMSYEWSNGSTTSLITVSPLINTTYLVMARDVNGCMDYTSVLVKVNALPIANVSGDFEICDGQETKLTATGGSSYLWNTGSSTNEITVKPSENTIYTVTVTDNNGCSASKSVQILVNMLPIAIISGNTTFCTGSSSLLTASGGISYSWNSGATTSSIMVNPGLSTFYTVTVTDSKGCTAVASRMATVNSLPEAKIVGENKICLGMTATLLASGGITYTWNTGQSSSAITVSPNENSIYTVTVTDVNGCLSSSAHGVVVNSLPIVSVTGINDLCFGDSTKLTANVSGNTFCDKDCRDELLLHWNFDACNAEGLSNQLDYTEFIPSVTSTGGLNSILGSIASRELGDHSCTPDGNGGAGICFGSLIGCDPNAYNPQNGLKFSITVKPNEIGQITKLTFREQSPLNWVTTNGATGINNYNEKYLIRIFKNGILVYSKNDLLTERTWNTETINLIDNPEFRVYTNAVFTFELYGYCIIERGGTAGWEIDDIKIFGGECSSSPVLDNISYLWSNGETSSMIEVSPASTTTYSVTVMDCNGCTAESLRIVTVNPLPIPIITGIKNLCYGESSILLASGGSTYLWSNGASTTSITVTPNITTSYSVTVTTVNGCVESTSATVTVHPLPVIGLVGDTEICNGETTRLTASGGTSYLWSNGVTAYWIDVTPATSTTYSVTVTDGNGCQASSSITVTVNPLPTATIISDTEI